MKLLRNLTSLFMAGFIIASASPLLAQTTSQPGIDSDGDGVNDDIDVEPCDIQTSLKRFDPADRVWGMMMFEDQWPSRSDFDFNDLVLAYNQSLNYNSAGLLTGIRLHIRLMAAGARQTNGLGFHVPGVAASTVQQLQLFVDGQPQPVGARTGDTDLVVTLTNDVHATFGVPAGTWVNTDPLAPTSPYVDIILTADFSPNGSVGSANAPFDIFLFNNARQTEVHLPQHRGTSALNPNLFNTADDGTSATRAFVTKGGIPFALIFPETVMYPTEGTSIASLFPTIVDFGLQLPGSSSYYRSPDLAHTFGSVSPGAFGVTTGTDVSCFTSDPGRCGASSAVGTVNPPSTGLCAFGSASTVSSSGGLFRWTCTGFYSTPSNCTAPDLVCQPNLSSSCTISNGSGAQLCNGSGSGYGTCTLSACNSGYYASGSTCVAQVCSPNTTRSCSIANGSGTETCNNVGSLYQNCTAASCNSGYTLSGNSCILTGSSDQDNDGVADGDEVTYGTSASSPDTDGDGMKDGVELAMGTNPTSPNVRPAASGSAVSSCGSLSSGTYHLTANVTAAPGASECFNVSSRDVTLDCRGYSINGNGAGNGFQLGGHKYFFTLRNCDVQGFRAGIHASAHNYYMQIHNSNFYNNVEHGVQTQHHNYFTRIENSRSSFNGVDGFHLDDFAQEVDLRGNVVKHNGNHGVLIREYRNWTWGWSNPTFTITAGQTFRLCGNQISNNASCEYSISSSGSAGTPFLAPGCYEPAPSEASCP